MKRVSAALPAALLAMTASPAIAEGQVWTGVFAMGPVARDSRLLVWFDVQMRDHKFLSDTDQTLIRPGLGVRVNKGLDLYAGYARVTTHRPGENVKEDRTWQQANFGIARIAGGNLVGRTRLEQRFRHDAGETGWRLRQFLRYGKPVAGPVSLVLSDEVFIGLNRTAWGQPSGYGQNRAFAGIAVQLAPKLRTEIGYMNQHIRNIGATPNRTNHNAVVQLFVTL